MPYLNLKDIIYWYAIDMAYLRSLKPVYEKKAAFILLFHKDYLL